MPSSKQIWIGLLAVAINLQVAVASDPVPVATLRGATVRVEAYVAGGHLRERYLALRDGAWVEVATSDPGGTVGPARVVAGDNRLLHGTVRGVSVKGGVLVEECVAGDQRLVRKLTLQGGGPWVRVVTRIEPSGPGSFHQFTDRLRFSGHPDWSFSPSVGGFDPDAQYKAPLILV